LIIGCLQVPARFEQQAVLGQVKSRRHSGGARTHDDHAPPLRRHWLRRGMRARIQ
jgi:hypothetical protein